jgi:phasin
MGNEEETMAERQPFEIPQELRDLAEKNIEQAKSAYSQLLDAMTSAMSAWTGSSAEMAVDLKTIQDRAAQFARENGEASFQLASDVAKARDLNEVIRLQSSFAQRQMQSFTTQAQELGQLMMGAARKAQR